MTKRDLKFIIGLIIIAVLALGGWTIYTSTQKNDQALVDVLYNEKVIHTFNYAKDEVFELDGDYGHMVIEVKDHRVRVSEVECPNHICEYTGWVEQGSYVTICCVPNDIIIVERRSE